MWFGIGVIVVAVLLTGAIALYRRHVDGRFASAAPAPAAPEIPIASLTAADLGEPLGDRASLVQFSSAFCAPCRTTRVLLADFTKDLDDVAHIEIDAESQLDLVRRLDIRRTPTVVVLNGQGEIVNRAAGVPTRAGVTAVLAQASASS